MIYQFLIFIKELKIKKIKAEIQIKRTKEVKEKKAPRFVDQERIRLKLIHAGSGGLIQKIGLNEYNYLAYKFAIATVSLISVADKQNPLEMLAYAAMGFSVIDLYLRSKKKKRRKEIERVMEDFIAITIDGLKHGQIPYEIFTMALKRIPEKNPLYSEIKILNVKVLNGSLKTALEEFRKRIDMEEMDNYCFALLQYEMGGRAVAMMTMQLKLMHSIRSNMKQRETQRRGNYSSIASALLVGAFLIIMLIPLVTKFKELPL